MYTRIDEHRLVVHGRTPATVHLPDALPVERGAIAELRTLCDLDGVSRIACTPDFHKGAGVPIGTVLLSDRLRPGLVGGDLGCGIRLDVIDGAPPEVTRQLRQALRHAFFQGGREVLVPDRGRLLAEGLLAPLEGRTARHVPSGVRAHAGGAIGGGGSPSALRAYLDAPGARCNVIGSIGGGNHFVELGVVDEVVDGWNARRLGLSVGALTVMVHSGSLDLGQQVYGTFRDRTLGEEAPRRLRALGGSDAAEYEIAADACANFAYANRAVLSAMVRETLGRDGRMVWDAPHNLAWRVDGGYLHRKGATPAAAGEPFLVPGSSGTRSLVGIGLGCAATLGSAPHGAGRSLGRNAARAAIDVVPDVVTRIDPALARGAVREVVEARLREEAPRAYKDVEAVARCVAAVGIGRHVAWLRPLLTIKG